MRATADIFEFEEFRLDRRGEGLSRRDERGVFIPLSVGLRALDVLNVLVERPSELVRKEEIIAAVWGRTAVENANLTVQISALRRVLDDGRSDGSCIQTVATRGYRFLSAVIRVEHVSSVPTASRLAHEDVSATRRLAAILAADVAGYSRLIEADEEGTLGRLKALRAEVIDPRIAAHRGRIVKTTGDGLLVEFASVVDALRCAVVTQTALAEGNGALPVDRRIEFRIGIHQGDIVVEDDDIFGDGVNIAARLEGVAEPGGICVSARVQEDAAGKLDLVFEDIGEQQLKNIARPIRVFRVAAKRVAPPGEQPAPPILQPAVAPRLSIVVLPFANLSNDPEQHYFADGITEDLTTDLSRIADMLVISRNTAFTYRTRQIDTKQIGRELGVRYVLEGSVRRSGNQVRVNAQLIEAESDTHLWAERFDHDIGDLFAIQNEITGRIANTLGWELMGAEIARPTDRPDTLDYILRGRAAHNVDGNYEEAVSLLKHALALDPRSVEAQSRLASALVTGAMQKDPGAAAADLRRAEELIAQALATSPSDSYARRVKGKLLLRTRRCGDAVPELEIALTADRNNTFALVDLSVSKFLTGGSDQDAISLTEQAIRLSPRDPNIGWWYTWIGFVHLLQSRVDEAIAWLEKGRSLGPRPALPHWHLAAAYGSKGDLERARAELAEAMKLTSWGRRAGVRYSSVARIRADVEFYTPAVRDRWETVYFPGIRAAGLPEE